METAPQHPAPAVAPDELTSQGGERAGPGNLLVCRLLRIPGAVGSRHSLMCDRVGEEPPPRTSIHSSSLRSCSCLMHMEHQRGPLRLFVEGTVSKINLEMKETLAQPSFLDPLDPAVSHLG